MKRPKKAPTFFLLWLKLKTFRQKCVFFGKILNIAFRIVEPLPEFKITAFPAVIFKFTNGGVYEKALRVTVMSSWMNLEMKKAFMPNI